ncbi:MAG: mitochondrial fission ELM1 family protein [Candidatus Omnitrophica bacterium]|nr:mitochondrial fission ELM1 family protein [Candidatus Omnitrophota bacterium]
MSGATGISTVTVQDFMAVTALKTISMLMRVFPRRINISVARTAGAVFSCVAKRRFIAENNIRKAYDGGLSESGIKQVAKGAYESIFVTVCELLLMRFWSDRTILNMIQYDDEQKILEYLKDSRGVIFVTGHYGNWELMSVFAGVLNYPLHVLAKPLKHRRLERYLNRIRSCRGARVVYRGAQMKELFRTLKAGGAVGIVADQDAGKNGIFAPLFGRSASCPEGIARMARATNSRIIPVFLRREKSGDYKVVVHSEIQPEQGLDAAHADRLIMKEFCACLESEVRLHPDQWLWQHKRWKSSPDRTILSISDGKAGHFKQTQMVVDRLAERLKSQGMRTHSSTLTVYKQKNRILSLISVASGFLSVWYAPAIRLAVSAGYVPETRKKLDSAAPDFIVSCGSGTEFASTYLKLRDRSRNCFIQTPQTGPGRFNAVLRPAYDRKPHHSVVSETPGPLALRASSEPINKDGVLLLIGGPSHHMKWDHDRFCALLELVLKSAAAKGLRVNISSSRRTPANAEHQIESIVQNLRIQNSCSLLIANRSNPAGLYEKYLSSAAYILVTADSLSMISEALTVCPNVALISLESPVKLGRKVRDLMAGAGLQVIENEEHLNRFLQSDKILLRDDYFRRIETAVDEACGRIAG